MKKILLFGFALMLGVFYSCNPEDENPDYGLGDVSKELTDIKVTAPDQVSIFEDFTAFLNMAIGETKKDSVTNLSLKLALDTVVCRLQTGEESSKLVSGSYSVGEDNKTVYYNLDSTVMLEETYILELTFGWENADGKPYTKNGSEVKVVRWIEFAPSVVDGKDVVFGTSRTGDNVAKINAYDGDMYMNLISDLLFDSIGSASEKEKGTVGFVFKSMRVRSNKSDDYTTWEETIDTANKTVKFMPVMPAVENHLIPNLFYSIDLQYYYTEVDEMGKNKVVMDSNGDTAVWIYEKVFEVSDLFVPGEIIRDVSPQKRVSFDIDIDTIPLVRLNIINGKEYTVANFNSGDTISFRPSLSRFIIIQEGDTLKSEFNWVEKGDYEWATDSVMGATIIPDSIYLIPSAKYNLVASAKWDFRIHPDSAWHTRRNVNGEVFEEELSVFTPVLRIPGEIVSELTPNITDDEDASMTTDVNAKFAYQIGQPVMQGGVKFIPGIDSLMVTNGDSIWNLNYELSEDGRSAVIKENDLFYPNTDYKIEYSVKWEYEDKNGEMLLRTTQEDEQRFKTSGRPSSIYGGKNTGRFDNPISIDPMIDLLANIETVYDITGEDIQFRPVIDSTSISYKDDANQNIVLDHDLIYQNDNTELVYKHGQDYEVGETYTINFVAHWEYRKGSDPVDQWRIHPDPLNICNEKRSPTFITSDIPDDKSLVKAYFPVSNLVDDSTIVQVFSDYIFNADTTITGTVFKPVLDSVKLYKDTIINEVDVEIVMGVGSSPFGVTMKPVSPLTYSTTYLVKGYTHWEYLKDGVYVRLEGDKYNEEIDHKFKVEDAPIE